MTMIKVTTALLAVSFLGACSAEMGAPEPVDEPVSQVTQKIAQGWNPRGLGGVPDLSWIISITSISTGREFLQKRDRYDQS